jgi:hypothetical protein
VSGAGGYGKVKSDGVGYEGAVDEETAAGTGVELDEAASELGQTVVVSVAVVSSVFVFEPMPEHDHASDGEPSDDPSASPLSSPALIHHERPCFSDTSIAVLVVVPSAINSSTKCMSVS